MLTTRIVAGAAPGQPIAQLPDHIGAVLSAHRGRQVQAVVAGALVERGHDLGGVVPGVDDHQHAVVRCQAVDQFGRGQWRQQIARPLDDYPRQAGKQCRFVVDDAARRRQAAQALARIEARQLGKRRLSGGAQQHGDAVVQHQQVQCIEDGLQKLRWQQLGFVEHDHAAGQAVQLAAA